MVDNGQDHNEDVDGDDEEDDERDVDKDDVNDNDVNGEEDVNYEHDEDDDDDVVDDDDVIKHNLSSIWKDKRNRQIKIIKILMMFVHRELQTNAENSNQDDDGTINWIKTRNT